MHFMADTSLLRAASRRLCAKIGTNFFSAAAAVYRHLPVASPSRYGLRLERDVPYEESGEREHLLDVYTPASRGPWPVLLYVHGGGFHALSKETHHVMALAFARQGHLVFNVNYRLAPRHRFPAGLEDVARAYGWVLANAGRYGGDLDRLTLAGESAGANLVTALAIMASYRRPEPWAGAVFDAAVRPRAVIAACGLLQVSDSARFARLPQGNSFTRAILATVEGDYVASVDTYSSGALDLADPLLFFERGDSPARPLPAFFAFAGTNDPVFDDTKRLTAALRKVGAHCEERIYPGAGHAFHAFVFRRQARQLWADTFAFLARQEDAPRRAATAP
jgi:acetyl esterase